MSLCVCVCVFFREKTDVVIPKEIVFDGNVIKELIENGRPFRPIANRDSPVTRNVRRVLEICRLEVEFRDERFDLYD